MGAAADCELIRFDLLGQPVNTITTLAFVVAGIWLLRRASSRWVGIALIATGFGSFLFHGPMPAWSEWAHDVTLAWLIVAVGALGGRWEARSLILALLALGIVFAVAPGLADPIAIALTLIVVGSIILSRRSVNELAPLAFVAAVAVLGRLGSTAGPLCDPGSPFQLHGLWHVGAAVGVAWWAYRTTEESAAFV